MLNVNLHLAYILNNIIFTKAIPFIIFIMFRFLYYFCRQECEYVQKP